MDRVKNRKDRRRRLRAAARVPADAAWAWQAKGPEVLEAFTRTGAWGTCIGCFVNARYSVQVFEIESDWGSMKHVAVRRHDAEPGISWADKQRIKDELVGEGATAIEVFPAKSELTDNANMYHLWVLPQGMGLPFRLEPA